MKNDINGGFQSTRHVKMHILISFLFLVIKLFFDIFKTFTWMNIEVKHLKNILQ